MQVTVVCKLYGFYDRCLLRYDSSLCRLFVFISVHYFILQLYGIYNRNMSVTTLSRQKILVETSLAKYLSSLLCLSLSPCKSLYINGL